MNLIIFINTSYNTYLHAIRVVSLLIYLSITVADSTGIIYVAGMGIIVVASVKCLIHTAVV